MNCRLMLSTTVFSLLVGTSSQAAIITSPSDLNPGDEYHLAFVTRDARDALSSNIANYNAFVQAQAALNPSLTGTDMGVVWKAIASTPTVNARNNALVQAPVYLIDGTTKIAAGFVDMWDGVLLAPIERDQFGELYRELVWTGTTHHGITIMPEVAGPGTSLGGFSIDQIVGDAGHSGNQWVEAGLRDEDEGTKCFFFGCIPGTPVEFPIYALSERLTVLIPEPAAASLLLTGVGTLALFWWRRRWARQSLS